MDLAMFLYTAILFFLLTPGILITIPPGGKQRMVAAVHAGVFAFVWGLSYPFVMQLLH
jgi:hypothetical protein